MTPNPADRSVVHFRLIGTMQAWTTAGEEISPPGLRTRALLAAIALSAPRPVQRVWLAGLLWSELSSTLRRTALHAEIQRLSDVLAPAGPDFLEVTRFSLSLRPGSVGLDRRPGNHASH